MKKIESTHVASKKRTSDIINSALECFTELGYNDTSMADICARANASIGSIYHHFKSKEQLAATVYLQGIEDYQTGILEIFREQNVAFKVIASVVKYHLTWIKRNPDWAQFLFQKKIHFSFINETEDALHRLNKKFASGISYWFNYHIAAGTIRKLSWDLIIPLLFGPCQEYTKLYLSKKSVTKIDDAIHELSLAIWRSFSNEK